MALAVVLIGAALVLRGGDDGDAGFHYQDASISVFGVLPKLGLGFGTDAAWLGVFLSNGFVTSFHVLPMPAPCHATNSPSGHRPVP